MMSLEPNIALIKYDSYCEKEIFSLQQCTHLVGTRYCGNILQHILGVNEKLPGSQSKFTLDR